jgi:hypothetical protein
MRRTLIACAVAAVALAGCGDDDTAATTTTEAPATTVTEPATAGPSEEFCSAYGDYLNAQDGAQLNTALGTMTAELPDDAPAEVSDALDTLSTGDLPAADYDAAGSTLEAWAGPACDAG